MRKILVFLILLIASNVFCANTNDDLELQGSKYVNNIKSALEGKNVSLLKDLLSETYTEEPVGDSLFNTAKGIKYYSLGSYLNELLASKDWAELIFLLENGASGFIEDGQSPIVRSYLTKVIAIDDSELLMKLISVGARTNINSYLGNITPDLVYAVKKKSLNCFKTLLDYGVDINQSYLVDYIGKYGSQIKYPIFKIIAKSEFLKIAKNYNVDFTVSEVKQSLTTIDGNQKISKVISSLVETDGKYKISERFEYLDYSK